MDILLSAGGSVSGDLADKSRAFLTPSYVHGRPFDVALTFRDFKSFGVPQ